MAGDMGGHQIIFLVHLKILVFLLILHRLLPIISLVLHDPKSANTMKNTFYTRETFSVNHYT